MKGQPLFIIFTKHPPHHLVVWSYDRTEYNHMIDGHPLTPSAQTSDPLSDPPSDPQATHVSDPPRAPALNIWTAEETHPEWVTLSATQNRYVFFFFSFCFFLFLFFFFFSFSPVSEYISQLVPVSPSWWQHDLFFLFFSWHVVAHHGWLRAHSSKQSFGLSTGKRPFWNSTLLIPEGCNLAAIHDKIFLQLLAATACELRVWTCSTPWSPSLGTRQTKTETAKGHTEKSPLFNQGCWRKQNTEVPNDKGTTQSKRRQQGVSVITTNIVSHLHLMKSLSHRVSHHGDSPTRSAPCAPIAHVINKCCVEFPAALGRLCWQVNASKPKIDQAVHVSSHLDARIPPGKPSFAHDMLQTPYDTWTTLRLQAWSVHLPCHTSPKERASLRSLRTSETMGPVSFSMVSPFRRLFFVRLAPPQWNSNFFCTPSLIKNGDWATDV